MSKSFCILAFLCGIAAFSSLPVVVFAAEDDVRPPAVAGQFYPENRQELEQAVKTFLAQAKKTSMKGSVKGLIVPHAGYVYSGPTAALGYAQVAGGPYDVVVVLAPSHRDPFMGGTIFPGQAYQTPLGIVSIDRTLATQLVQDNTGYAFSELGHRLEHSVEVQLPFIQTVLPGKPVVPIVIGGYDWNMLERMGRTLAAALKGRRALVVASSDLYHGQSYDECEKTNTRTINAMLALKPKTLCEGFLDESLQACGGGPISLMESALIRLGAERAVLLGRTNSNDVTGQRGGYIVGYAAVAITGGEDKMDNPNKIEFQPLDKEAQKVLLNMAREAISQYLQTHKTPKFEPTLQVLKEMRGVFVTITENGELRGCIGYHEADRPLYELVPDRAVAAAFEDPRFMPLRASELSKIKIKVSVYLTNVYRINSLDEFKMGEHGIIMVKNGRGATYLPEVPAEAGWKTVREEMESLCHKAGLSADAWKQGAEFYVYKTQVFGEK
jgi:MEMO1 family protein